MLPRRNQTGCKTTAPLRTPSCPPLSDNASLASALHRPLNFHIRVIMPCLPTHLLLMGRGQYNINPTLSRRGMCAEQCAGRSSRTPEGHGWRARGVSSGTGCAPIISPSNKSKHQLRTEARMATPQANMLGTTSGSWSASENTNVERLHIEHAP